MNETSTGSGTPSGARLGRRSLLAAAAAAVTGCSTGRAGGSTSQPSETLVVSESAAAATDAFGGPTDAVVAALNRTRGAALLAGDERAFLAGLDPAAGPLIDSQRLLLANLRQLGVTAVSLVTRPAEHSTQVADGTFDVPVTHVVRLAADSGPDGVGAAETYTYRYRRRGDGWVVSAVTPTATCILTPWSVTRVTVAKAPGVWLVADATAPEVAGYAQVAVTEAATVHRIWGQRFSLPGAVLCFTRDDASFRSWFNRKDHPVTVTAVEGLTNFGRYAYASGEPYTAETPAVRVSVQLKAVEQVFGRIGASGDAALETQLVIRHELVHGLTARLAPRADDLGYLTGDIVRWAIEGFARFVEHLDQPARQRASEAYVRDGVRRGLFAGRPPASKTFYDTPVMSFNYELSSTIFEFVRRRRDLEAAVTFYDDCHRVADLDEVPFLGTKAFDHACRTATGLAAPAFLQQWSSYVRGL